MYVERDRTPNQCLRLSLVATEDSAPMSADVPPTAMDEASEASPEEEPLRQVKANQPQKNQRPAPVHVTQRATEQWSSLAGSGPWAQYRACFPKRACPVVRTY
jgi:hypothetical protein